MNEKSPCIGCWNCDGDKSECAKHCMRLENYQYGRPYQHIIPWRQIKPIHPEVKKCLICGKEESEKIKLRRGLCIGICYAKWRVGKLNHPKEKKKYQVDIKVNYKNHFIGYFNTIELAKVARLNAELKYWGKQIMR